MAVYFCEHFVVLSVIGIVLEITVEILLVGCLEEMWKGEGVVDHSDRVSGTCQIQYCALIHRI